MEKNTYVRFFVIMIFFFSLFISSKGCIKKNKEVHSQNSEKAEIFSMKDDLDKSYENNIIYGGDQNIPEIKNNNLNKEKESVYKDKDIITGINSSDFADLPVEARGVFVFDLKNSREIYGKNAGIKFSLASLAKLMTAAVALENLKEDETIEISENAVSVYGESNLSVNEKWRLYDLIDIMLVNSSNDAAIAISEKFEQIHGKKIIDFMNEKAKKLGMRKTVFYNSTGLDLKKSAGAYGTPKDVRILMEYILNHHPRLFLKTKEASISATGINGEVKNFANTNIYADKLKNLIGGKTGFTELSGGNFTFIFDAGNKNYYTVVLLKSSFSGRFQDALTLQKKLFVNY